MAITFGVHQKKEKKQVIIIAVLVVVGVLVVMFIMKRQPASLPVEMSNPAGPEINWEALSDQRIKDLQPFEEIPVFEGEVGRENPFLPY